MHESSKVLVDFCHGYNYGGFHLDCIFISSTSKRSDERREADWQGKR